MQCLLFLHASLSCTPHVRTQRVHTMQAFRYKYVSLDTCCCVLLSPLFPWAFPAVGLSQLQVVSLVALGFPCLLFCVPVAFDCVLTLTFHAMKCME